MFAATVFSQDFHRTFTGPQMTLPVCAKAVTVELVSL